MRLKLTQSKTAKIDNRDWPLVKDHKWHYAEGNAFTIVNKRKLRLVNLLLKPKVGERVIFLNQDRLDCRRSNLAVGTIADCVRHQRIREGGFSKYRGVCRKMGKYRRARWRAEISANGRRHYIGNYVSEAQAARAYNNMATELHGKFAVLNKL